MLARLSQLIVSSQVNHAALADEGDILLLTNGCTAMNPRHKLIAQNDKHALALTTKLGITADIQKAQTQSADSVGRTPTRTAKAGTVVDYAKLAKAVSDGK